MLALRAYFYRLRFVISVILATVLPILVTGIVLLNAAEQVLLAEKKQKLIAITEQMDFALPHSFAEMLAQSGMKVATREDLRPGKAMPRRRKAPGWWA